MITLRMEKNEKSHPEEIRSTLPVNSGSALEKAIPSVDIESLIYVIRDEQVMLDSDLAKLYGVETKVLNKPSNVIYSAFRKISCFN